MFGGGGGGMNPRKMKQMMKQMGIDVEEIDAEEIRIRMADGEELVFTDPDVTRMDARGQKTYQVVGEPETSDADEAITAGADADTAAESSDEVPQDDVEIVAQRTGASEDEVREALRAVDGDLAAAVDRLE